MLCEHARAEITAYLAEELPPEVRIPLEAHVTGCASCSAEIEALQKTWSALGALPVPRPAPDLEARVLARTMAEATPLRPWRLLRPLRVPVAAFIAVLLSVGLSRLVPYEAAARLCREGLEGLPFAGGVSEAAGAFPVGVLYAAPPVLLAAFLTARLEGHRPLPGGGRMAAFFLLALTPYVLAVCWALPGAFVGSLLAGLTAGAVTGGLCGSWLGRRGALAAAAG